MDLSALLARRALRRTSCPTALQFVASAFDAYLGTEQQVRHSPAS